VENLLQQKKALKRKLAEWEAEQKAEAGKARRLAEWGAAGAPAAAEGGKRGRGSRGGQGRGGTRGGRAGRGGCTRPSASGGRRPAGLRRAPQLLATLPLPLLPPPPDPHRRRSARPSRRRPR
jgi:hypothetical protein